MFGTYLCKRREKLDPFDKTTSSLSKMPSPWSQQVAGPQRKLKSRNMKVRSCPREQKMQGFPIEMYLVWLLYIGGRGAEVITAAHPCYLPPNQLAVRRYHIAVILHHCSEHACMEGHISKSGMKYLERPDRGSLEVCCM